MPQNLSQTSSPKMTLPSRPPKLKLLNRFQNPTGNNSTPTLSCKKYYIQYIYFTNMAKKTFLPY